MKLVFSNLFKIIILLIGFLVVYLAFFYTSTDKLKIYKFNYFNSLVSINLGQNQPALSSNTLSKIDNILKEQDNKWSLNPGSYLDGLNNSLTSGNIFKADNETIELINKLKLYYQTSNGYFNPTIGKLVDYWKDSNNNSLSIEDYLTKLPKPEYININGNNLTTVNSYLQLDIKGIITAHVLSQIRQILLDNKITNAQISMGNDLYVIKSDNSNENFRVIQKSTNSRKMPKLSLKVYDNEFLSTSGAFVKDYHNFVRTIINPKTGKPSDGFYGATVIDSDPYKANVASIALIVAGNDNYKAVAESLGIKDYILYTYENKIILSDSMRNRIT